MMPDEEAPDFRNMTPDDLRGGISRLNAEIRRLKRINRQELAFHIEALEEQRQRYKQVWRARPGRAFHDVAARRERVKKQRIAKVKKVFGIKP